MSNTCGIETTVCINTSSIWGHIPCRCEQPQVVCFLLHIYSCECLKMFKEDKRTYCILSQLMNLCYIQVGNFKGWTGLFDCNKKSKNRECWPSWHQIKWCKSKIGKCLINRLEKCKGKLKNTKHCKLKNTISNITKADKWGWIMGNLFWGETGKNDAGMLGDHLLLTWWWWWWWIHLLWHCLFYPGMLCTVWSCFLECSAPYGLVTLECSVLYGIVS